MTPTKLPRLPAVDALRGIAASIVVAGHVTFATGTVGIPYWGWWWSRSEFVVSLFFVVSGFVLFRPFVNARVTGGTWPSLRVHLTRRFLRITPAYWLTVIVAMTLLLERPGDGETWLRHLTYTQFYGSGELLPGIGQAWTLTVEAVFYLLLPLIAFLILGRTWRPRLTVLLCLLLIPVSIGWSLSIGYGALSPFVHHMWFPAYAACFGVGMALAAVEVALLHGKAPSNWRLLKETANAPWAWLTLGAGLLAVAATPIAGPRGGFGVAQHSEFAVRQMLYVCIATCVLIPVAFGGKTRLHAFLGTLPMRWLGTVSFGIFLWHPFVILLIDNVSGRPSFGREPVSMYLMTMAGSVALAAVSWYLIERPAVNWSRARARPKGPVGRQPQHHDGTEPGQLRQGGAVNVDGPVGKPRAEEEQGRWEQPQPAPGGELQLDPVARGHPAHLPPRQQEPEYPGNGHQDSGQPADGDHGKPAEEVEPVAADSVPPRYLGQSPAPRHRAGQ